MVGSIILELNIRLDVIGRPVNVAQCDERAAMTLRMLDRSFAHIEARRQDEHNLVVRIESALLASTTFDAITEVVQALEQDCIAIYEPATGKGELFGPRWEQWPAFDPALFVRL